MKGLKQLSVSLTVYIPAAAVAAVDGTAVAQPADEAQAGGCLAN